MIDELIAEMGSAGVTPKVTISVFSHGERSQEDAKRIIELAAGEMNIAKNSIQDHEHNGVKWFDLVRGDIRVSVFY